MKFINFDVLFSHLHPYPLHIHVTDINVKLNRVTDFISYAERFSSNYHVTMFLKVNFNDSFNQYNIDAVAKPLPYWILEHLFESSWDYLLDFI